MLKFLTALPSEKLWIFALPLEVMDMKVLSPVGVLPVFQERPIEVYVRSLVLVHGILLVCVSHVHVLVKTVTIIVLKSTNGSCVLVLRVIPRVLLLKMI